MKTRDCVRSWVESMVSGIVPRREPSANSCRGFGKYFLSYSTPIAKYENGRFVIATRKYSCTTSKQQGYLNFFAHNYDFVEVEEIKDNGEFPFRR